MQVLKSVVVFMAVLIVAGLGLLGYGLIGRTTPDSSAGMADVMLTFPAGCSIGEASVSEGKLLIRGDGPVERGCQQVLLVDMQSGRTLGRVWVQAGP